MSDKLLEALDAVVQEISSMSPIELNKALQEASKSEFAQTIDTINQFISTINHNKQSNDNKEVSLFLPIENTTPSSKTDEEDLPPIGLVSKTPYRDIATYKEEWYTHPIDK